MSRDDQVVLDVDDGQLCVDGPDDVVDDVATALAADKEALQTVVDVFGPVTVISAGTPPVWPPKGGFVPAWRRVSPTRPLIVLPSERVPGLVDPFAVEPPTAPCPTCAVTQTRSAAPEPIFDTGPWQTCSRCGGRRWRSTPQGDVCVACGPPSGREPMATTWVRAGCGWVCTRCHPAAPTDDTRTICEICGGKGRCRPDHDVQLRRFGERLLRRTRSAAKQETIRAALATLPAVAVPAPDVPRPSRVVQSWRPPADDDQQNGEGGHLGDAEVGQGRPGMTRWRAWQASRATPRVVPHAERPARKRPLTTGPRMPTELVTGAVIGHVDINDPEESTNGLVHFATVLVRRLEHSPYRDACGPQRDRA